jgi:hypothetical protein
MDGKSVDNRLFVNLLIPSVSPTPIRSLVDTGASECFLPHSYFKRQENLEKIKTLEALKRPFYSYFIPGGLVFSNHTITKQGYSHASDYLEYQH